MKVELTKVTIRHEKDGKKTTQRERETYVEIKHDDIQLNKLFMFCGVVSFQY